MGQLMDELLSLAQISGKEPNLQQVGLNSMIEEVIDVLQPEQKGGRCIGESLTCPLLSVTPR